LRLQHFQLFLILSEGLHRKVSHDILELWKKNIRPIYDREMTEMENKEREKSKLEEEVYFRVQTIL
jgi:hypothetical protein